jgi:hypothetical protein
MGALAAMIIFLFGSPAVLAAIRLLKRPDLRSPTLRGYLRDLRFGLGIGVAVWICIMAYVNRNGYVGRGWSGRDGHLIMVLDVWFVAWLSAMALEFILWLRADIVRRRRIGIPDRPDPGGWAPRDRGWSIPTIFRRSDAMSLARRYTVVAIALGVAGSTFTVLLVHTNDDEAVSPLLLVLPVAVAGLTYVTIRRIHERPLDASSDTMLRATFVNHFRRAVALSLLPEAVGIAGAVSMHAPWSAILGAVWSIPAVVAAAPTDVTMSTIRRRLQATPGTADLMSALLTDPAEDSRPRDHT